MSESEVSPRTLPDIMFLELGKDRGYLLGRQPTEGSPEPPEEDDDAGLVPPQLLEGGHLLGGGVGQLALGDGGRVHPCLQSLQLYCHGYQHSTHQLFYEML